LYHWGSKQCIVVSQVRSIVELAAGEAEAARETQATFVSSADANLQKTPVVGHARGTVAYFMGDSETGNHAMLEATKTTISLGVLISAWHVGIVVGAATSVVVPSALVAGGETETQETKQASLNGSCLCVGNCVCLP